ncbi:uncharacterized protein N7477_005170 [Penicillium maclennaniae]|uniref:uncharacterized protein n=1 Tax=Penicillium maclennaniae TaxID=1343394 RepID=UPI00253F8524|nr:uncharacterized protein N7477_005170 [Penicillium maclennaniae]KAJ5675236.1 hypothetical protein N7477_005170 [Penicillium maclennaniae]
MFQLGLGSATAELFAQHGAIIAISDLDEGKSRELVESLRKNDTEAESFSGNLMDPSYPERLVQAVIARFGRINCLVNNAGFLNDRQVLQKPQPHILQKTNRSCSHRAIHKMTDSQWDSIIQIHNSVPFRIVRALSSHFMSPETANNRKVVINISSSSGVHGQLGQLNYCTAKSGVVGMTKGIAREWARYNVRCNAVAYGWMDTRMTRPPEPGQVLKLDETEIKIGVAKNATKFRDTSDIPLGRPGTPEEAAGCLLFLASNLSSYVTGQVLECNGGRFM